MTGEQAENVDLVPAFLDQFGRSPEVIGRGPGRIDLIGGHTDYNDGFVFPIALERHVAMAAARRDDRTLRVHSINFDAHAEMPLDDLQKSPDALWMDYIAGVAHFLQEKGVELCGMDAVVWGNVPVAAGLSSSAAIEVTTAMTFQALTGFEMDRVQMALLCQRAENDFVGMNCGIMDQFIALLGRKGHALLIDCRSLEYELVPIPADGHKFVVCDTRVPRELVDSEYNTRRAQCEEAVRLLKQRLPDTKALRDVSVAELEANAELLPEEVLKRARHVVTENQRVLDTVEALKRRDLAEVGRLLTESHESHRHDYEVTVPALDIISETAVDVDGALGARMAGAGFGGCAIALVREEAIPAFRQELVRRYQRDVGHDPELYVCEAEDGARVERP
ncbi:MAG: galactokinase [Armatimonadota bacterium]